VSATSASIGPPVRAPRARRAWLRVYRAEQRKLASQLVIRLLALVCVLGPFLFAAILKIQSGSPADTLYGAWVHSSGFALSLVVLAFAGQWGFPVIAGIVAGDMFSAEDRYGTWKLVLTRSCTRRDLFVGKLLVAATFTTGFLVLTAVASVLAGVLLVGTQSLVSLSGTVFSAGHLLALVSVSWLLNVPAALAFASLGVLCSIASRNGIMGVIGPALAALAMQLLLLVGSGVWMHMLLVGGSFYGWHALFTTAPFYGTLLIGIGVSAIWTVACLAVAWRMLRRRDFAGAPVSRRQGWVMPVRASAALAAVIALVAIASNWGPAGITPVRLNAALIPTFNNLTLLQQRELGRAPVPGASLNIVLPTCSRRGSTTDGPGEWICTMNVLIPTQSSLPPEPTVVSYDVSVSSDGCYKAQSPPAFIGQQTMRDADGHTVVNPLYTIYGCFNML
jgi:ABC-2 type transport system permease protein